MLSICVCYVHVIVVYLRLLPVCVCCLSVCGACVSDLVHFATGTLAQQPKGAIRPPADLQISALSLGPRVQVHRPIQAGGTPVRVAVPCLTILHHTESLQSQRRSSLRLHKPKLCLCSCTSPDIAFAYVPLTTCLRLTFCVSTIMDSGKQLENISCSASKVCLSVCASDYVHLAICPVASRELLL